MRERGEFYNFVTAPFVEKYRVVILADNSGKYAANGLEFDTVQDGESYAFDLFSRWLGAKEWAVMPLEIGPDEGAYWSTGLVLEKSVKRSDE